MLFVSPKGFPASQLGEARSCPICLVVYGGFLVVYPIKSDLLIYFGRLPKQNTKFLRFSWNALKVQKIEVKLYI